MPIYLLLVINEDNSDNPTVSLMAKANTRDEFISYILKNNLCNDHIKKWIKCIHSDKVCRSTYYCNHNIHCLVEDDDAFKSMKNKWKDIRELTDMTVDAFKDLITLYSLIFRYNKDNNIGGNPLYRYDIIEYRKDMLTLI